MSILNILAAGFDPYRGVLEKQAAIKQNALRDIAIRKGIREESYDPEEREWLRQQRELQRAKGIREQTAFEEEQKTLPLKRHLMASEWLVTEGPRINYGNYKQKKAQAESMGLMAGTLPDISVFDTEGINTGTPPDEVFSREWDKYWKTSKMELEEFKAKSGRIEAEAKRTQAEKERGTNPSWHTLADPNSPTGYSLKNVNDPNAKPIINAPPPAGSQSKDEKIPSAMKDFEMSTFGKEVPDQRGTPEYIKKRMDWIRSQREQSPYVDALLKQIDANMRREAGSFRKEFNELKGVKHYYDLSEKLDVMEAALEKSRTAKNMIAVDQALITTYNKFTDPDSVVRESEYARTPENMPLINRFEAAFLKMKKGGVLTPDDREALVDMARSIYRKSEQGFKERLSEYHGYLRNLNVEPEQYIKTPKFKSMTVPSTKTSSPTVIRYNSKGERVQ